MENEEVNTMHRYCNIMNMNIGRARHRDGKE
jgi:hypothetical protein